MHTDALQAVVQTILRYSSSEKDALGIIEAMSQVNWKRLLETNGIIECEVCGYVYDICKKPSTWICPRCDPNKQREKEKLAYTIQSERKDEKNLTLEQWIERLDYFDWKCAYCLENQYRYMDHFIPRSKNGMTTTDNCIPCCRLCNNRKQDYLPQDIKLISLEVVQRVQSYLHQFS